MLGEVSRATMTSNRFRRIVRARWWVLAIVALVTIVVATVSVNARNDSIFEREATASITFQRLAGELDDTGLQQRLADASQIAIEINRSQIATGIDPQMPGALAEIVTDTLSGRLLFLGRGDTDTAASGLAAELRDRYLQAQPLDDSAEINRRIAQATVQLDDVIALIATATQEAPIEEEEIARRFKIRELQAEVSALTSRYGALTVELITPTDPPRAAAVIEAERTAIRRQLKTTEQELLKLEAAEVEAAPEGSEIALLRSEETQLRLLLDDLVAQRFANESVGTVDTIEAGSSGIEPLRSLPIQALALVLGLFIGLAGLVLVDRSRNPVWATTDLQPQYRLPEIAKRPHSSDDHTSQSWYSLAPQGLRKAGVQQLRSHVEGLQNFGAGVTVGISSLSSESRDVHELAADLAASLSGSGTRTLLIDADFGDPTDLSEFRRSGCDLKMALDNPTGCLSQADPDTDESSISGISISQQIADSPDILARPEFADLLTAAKYEYGVVIIACPPSSTAGYHVLTQRLDAMILVSEIGAPRPNELDSVLHTLEDRRAAPLGVVLLTASGNPLQSVINRIPGGFSFRQETDQGSEIQNVEDETQQQPDGEAPTPVTTPGDGSDTAMRKPAPSAGFRVDIVSGSNPEKSTGSDDSGPRLSHDGPPAQAASTSSAEDAAKSTPATTQTEMAEDQRTDSSSEEPPSINVDGAPSEKNPTRRNARPITPTTEEDSSATEANPVGIRGNPTESRTEDRRGKSDKESAQATRAGPDSVAEEGAPKVSSGAATGGSTSISASSDKAPDGLRSDSDPTVPRESAPQPAMAIDAVVTDKVSNKKNVTSPPPSGNGKDADQTATVASGTNPRRPTTDGASGSRRRNAKGQFLPVEPPKDTSTSDPATGEVQTPTSAAYRTAGTETPEEPSDPASANDRPADATT